jgi:hypothetical protein
MYNNYYSYGILSPLDAVMKAVGNGLTLVSGSNDYLLGARRDEE